jgi:aminopeptidase N
MSPDERQDHLLKINGRRWSAVGAGISLLWCVAVARAQTTSPQFEVTHYAINAQLYPSTHILTAQAQVDFVPQANLTYLAFELHSALHVQKVMDANSQDLSFKQQGPRLEVDFTNPPPQGQPSSITVSYKGELSSAEGSPVEGLQLAYVGTEGSYLLYTGRWFPVNAYGFNRFSATMHITVPPGEVVVASGKTAPPAHEPGSDTYTFDFDQKSFPGSVYAGPYVVRPAAGVGADVTLYLLKAQADDASSYADATGKILSFFSDKFGPLPFHHLDLVEIPNGTLGGDSTPGVVALAQRGFTKPVNYQLLAHEISRQWWRCMASPATPNDAFLDEGLATYSAAMILQEVSGEAAFEARMHDVEISALTHEEVSPVSQAGRLQEFTPEYQSIVFYKGAMVFHMLRWVIGDEAFFKTLQAMTRQYAWKSISTQDFQHLAEQASNQELTYFFALWVDSTGVPQFKRTWAIYRTAKGYEVVGKITQDLDLFRMPVEVRVYTEAKRPISQRVEMVGTTANFVIDSPIQPKRVVVDPASRLLKYDQNTTIDVEMARGDQLVEQQAYLEAIAQYQKVLKLNTNYSLAHYRIGENLFRLHNYSAAAEEMRQALDGDLNPKWVEVWAHLTLGKIFDVTGQRDRALHEYQLALQTNDNTQGALDEANRYIQKPYTEKSHALG